MTKNRGMVGSTCFARANKRLPFMQVMNHDTECERLDFKTEVGRAVL